MIAKLLALLRSALQINRKDMTPIETHDLGTFASVTAVWSAYPEGGHEGDYCTINGVTYRWNKYNRQWENSQLVNETTGRMVETFDGDVNIQNNLTVAGTLRAKRLKQPNCGMFGTVEALESAYPNPEVGMWAVVGDEMPGAIYRCDVEGVWEATGETGGVDGLLDDSYEQRIAALESNLDGKVDKETGKGLSTNDYTDAEQSKLSELPTASDIATSLASKADQRNVEQTIYAKQYVIGDEKHGEKVYLQEHGKSGTEYVTFSLGKSNRHTIVPIPSRSDTSIKLATVEDISGSIDMSGYYDKTQTDALLKGKANLHGSGKEYFRANALHMTSVPSEGEESDGNEIFATNRYNNGHQFVTIGYGAHVVKMNIPDGEETVTLATLDDVTGEIDMSGYYDKEEVDELVKDMVVPVTATNNSDEVITDVDANDVYNALEAKRTVVYRVAYASGNPSVRYFQVMGKTPGGIIAVYNDGAGDMERLIHVGTSISLSRLRNVQVLASMGEDYDGGHSYTPEYGDYFYANGKIYVETHVNTPDSEHVSEPLEVGVPDKNIIYCNALTNVQYRWEGSSWSSLTGAIFTKDEKLKLLEIEAGAEVNKIASVRVNGSDLPIRNKAVSLDGVLATKQDALVSGSNIKTINNQSLLGSGNINISGGGGSGVVYVNVTGTSSNLSADKTFSEVVGFLNEGSEVVYVYSGVYYRVTSYDVNHISAVVVDGEYIRYLTHTSTEHVGTLLLGVIGDALMDTIDDLLAAKQDKSMLVTVTENSGVFTADKTFAEVDAALTAGQLVRFFDGTNYFDITGYIATMVVVASYTTGATNEKFTYTPSGLTWERTLLAPKDSPALTGTPTAPTAASGTNTTQIATTEFVSTAVGNIPAGKSAYQSYVDTTTDVPVKMEAEWVASLKGEDGAPGAAGPQGPEGPQGPKGDSGVDLGEVVLVNDLTTGGEESALSAEQGKELKNEFDGATQITGVASTTGYHVFYSNGTLRAESSASYTAPINVTKGQIIKVVVSTLNTNYSVIAKVLTEGASYQNKVKYVNNQSTYIWIADEDCQIAISFKTADGYRAYIMTDTRGLWDNVMGLKALEPKVDNLTDAIDIDNYTLLSRIVATDSVASWGNRNTIVGCNKAFSQRSLLDKVKMFIFSPKVGSVVKFYLGKIDQRNWLLPRLTFTAYVTSLEEISLGDKTSVIDLSSYHIIAEEGEVLFFSPQPTTSNNATFGWSIPATIPNVTFYKTSDINTALETDSRGIRWFEITAKSVETYLALETDVEKINTAIEQQAESIAKSKIYYDRTTGEAYKIIVNNGAIQLKSASVNSLLVLGHSFAAYGEAGIWQCNDNRGMAATIAANDYPAQMKAILGASTLSKMNVADWERNLINYNFASNWGVTDVYDAIVLFVGANIVDTSNVYQGYVEALAYLKQAAPTADIYVVSMSIGAIYDGAKNAASAMKVGFIDITYLSKYPLTHLMGDYYIGKNSTYYEITANGVANHPADYGHWLIAQAITLGMGNETNVDPTHNITLMQAVGGTISAAASVGIENGVISIKCDANEGYTISSLTVTDGSNNSVIATARTNGSGTFYTFIMPSSDVTVTPTWVAE